MVEKIDVAFDACDANAEGAGEMMHGDPRLLNSIGRGMRSVANGSGSWKLGKNGELTCAWGLASSRCIRRNRAPFGR